MPTIRNQNPDLAPADDAQTVIEAREEFIQGFFRTNRGNLCREWEGYTVTVFSRESGGYGWCISSEETGPSYSKRRFRSEEAALESLAGELIWI